MQLGCETDEIDLLRSHPEPGGDVAAQPRDLGGMRVQIGTLLLDDRQQQVAHLQPGRAPLCVLALIHAPVGERERGAGCRRLVRE